MQKFLSIIDIEYVIIIISVIIEKLETIFGKLETVLETEKLENS